MYRSSTGISLGQVYLLSLLRLQKRVISMTHPDSFLSFCRFAFLLLKENIHLLLRFCAESLIYRSHEELLEYALEDECLGGEGGPHAEIPVGEIIHAQNGDELFF